MFKHVSTALTFCLRLRATPKYSGLARGFASRNPRITPDRKVTWDAVSADPRPPWVYTASLGLRLVLVPSALLYAVFFADFGENEHVFMPPRRWLERQKAAFFTLSPAEKALSERAVDTTPPPPKPTTEERA
ncbi:hypothetical protein FA95DRAFT_1610559 [Auriscalpium vulgare]|uniref:Uncharacterized protein n=1 Tax=Auriscalpium vulgare TaxID=40419 RepID=A0ACB8RCZ6_9AGAM|nr:hypothetical protein FA95DRAFT_1610559 [Auriscalpium vulgare]